MSDITLAEANRTLHRSSVRIHATLGGGYMVYCYDVCRDYRATLHEAYEHAKAVMQAENEGVLAFKQGGTCPYPGGSTLADAWTQGRLGAERFAAGAW